MEFFVIFNFFYKKKISSEFQNFQKSPIKPKHNQLTYLPLQRKTIYNKEKQGEIIHKEAKKKKNAPY